MVVQRALARLRVPHCRRPNGTVDGVDTTVGRALEIVRSACLPLPTDVEPDRFFRPPYVGGRGWIGMRLDRRIDETEIAGICDEAFCVVAPPTLVRVLRERAPSG
ncbi:hypothetical protein BH18ACT3_BH18ACT3_00430 [soil metagenome]